MSVGARLREERQRLGFSQERLATMAGVAKNTAINWEKDASSPTASALIALAEAGVDAVYILTGKRPHLREIGKLLAAIRSDLLNPWRSRGPNESEHEAEERVREEASAKLQGIIEFEGPRLTPDQLERVRGLREITDDSTKWAQFRADAFTARRESLDVQKKTLEALLKRCDYQPSEEIIKRLARLVLDYDVPRNDMIELSQEIFTDVRGASGPR